MPTPEDFDEVEFERKTAINIRAQARYDELMREGKHGHYETMFRVIHECIDRFAAQRGAERLQQAAGNPLEGVSLPPRTGGGDAPDEIALDYNAKSRLANSAAEGLDGALLIKAGGGDAGERARHDDWLATGPAP